MAKLTLDGSVNLQKLQQFAEQAGDKSIRMKTEDGVKVLYTSDKKNTGIKNFFTGQTDRRQQRALNEIRTLLTGFQRDSGTTGAQIDGNILAFVPVQGRMKGDALANVVKATRDDALGANETAGNGALLCYAFESRDPEAMNSLVSKLTTKLQEKVDNRGTDELKNEYRNFLAAYDGTVAKNAMLRSMAQVQGGHIHPDTTYETATPELKQFLDEAYNMAVAGLDGHRCLDPNGDEIEFKGVKYVREKRGGEGGFGTVDIYKRDGGEERIAVKRPIIEQNDTPKEKGEKFTAYLNEYREHVRVGGGGDPNVVGIQGMLRGAQGEPLIVLDCAPHGNVYGCFKALSESTEGETVKTTVALTLLQDMAKGICKAHQEGVVHLDLKTPNYLIGEDGKALLTDMGTSGGQIEQRTLEDGTVVTGARVLFDKNEVDNPIWSAPELLYEAQRVGNMRQAITNLVQARVDIARAELESHGIHGEQLDRLLEDVRIHNEAKITQAFSRRQLELTEKADVWSFGICAYQLLFGKELPESLDHRFVSQMQNKIKEFGNTKTNQIFVPNDGEELTPEQEFVNWILHPDPDQRPTMQEIIDDPIFLRLGVGSDEAYDVVKGLNDPNGFGNQMQSLKGLVG